MYKTFIEAREMKLLTAKERLKQISSHCSRGRWLDSGYSDGSFVEQAQLQGMQAEGIDLSEVAIEEARKRNFSVYYSSVENFEPGHKYDTITAFDVLEHVLDPVAFVQAVRNLLLPGGKVVLSLPDQGSLICKLMGKSWYFYIPEEHLHYFKKSTIAKLLTNAGFVVERHMPTYKPLTYNYSLTQFMEYNPLIYKVLSLVAKLLSEKIKNISIPLYIGEMMVIARN
jgi:2-polyprenyl-3-methyl-5-hydroxy-6-metoxy-1,4-benzoquinol methylase